MYSSIPMLQFQLPAYNEIPNVGLFLEQVSKYVNEYLRSLGQPELTGSMISNYVKKDIIPNPVKKQYGRDQIADLLFIAVGKTVLPLEELRAFLRLRSSAMETREFYAFFTEEFPKILSAVASGEALPEPGLEEDREIRTVKRLSREICVTAARKIWLDHIFEHLPEVTA